MSSLSERARRSRHFTKPLKSYYADYFANAYDEEHNTGGIINMGMAENYLCEDILTERLNRADMIRHEPEMQFYAVDHNRVPKAVAKFMTERFNAAQPIEADDIRITMGAGSALETLAYVYADPEDTFLCLAPHFMAIVRDIGFRMGVRCHSIQLDPKNSFKITRDILEQGFRQASEQGRGDVKAMIVINPNNPLGDVYDVETLRMILDFCHSHDIHAIFDEIYALSVFDPDTKFHSVLSMEDLPDPLKTHVVWGTSKDFALSGYRFGVICSKDREGHNAVSQIEEMEFLPTMMRYKIITLLEDADWLDNVYFPANLSRLREAFDYSCERLSKMGIRVHPSKAAFFIWADFSKVSTDSKLIVPLTAERQMEVFQEIFNDGTFMLPGLSTAFHQPGWMRIVFSSPNKILKIGFDRLEKCLEKIGHQAT